MEMKIGEKKERAKTVVVVGAGAAGLQAANLLLESAACLKGRLEVIVLEGRDRVGGRICVDRTWGVPFDLGILTCFLFVMVGPNWIHGTLSNPLIPIAKVTGSQLTFPDEGSQIIYTSSGEPLPPENSRLLYDCIWRYAAEAINFSTDEGESVSPEWSMYDFCVERIREDKALGTELKHLALQLVELLTTFTAVDVRKQSLRYYQVEAELAVHPTLEPTDKQGDCPFVASTFESTLTHLALPAKAAGILHLSTVVTHISLRSDHMLVTTINADYRADVVIVTVPLGCLQRATIKFQPPLPSRVQSAISNLGFGNLEKLFLKFEVAWWVTDASSDGPEIFTFLPPKSLPRDVPSQLITMFSLASIPVHAQPVLVVYTADAWSSFLARQTVMAIADLFQTHYLPLLPNYSGGCVIQDVRCTNWTNDRFTYGSYTHVPVGSKNGLDDLFVLGERIVGIGQGKGGLWFAGEHAGTADLATVNGAMSSGSSAASQVLQALGEGHHDIINSNS